LREFDLRLALSALGVSGENVEDQCRSINDLDSDAILEIPQLGECQFAVADHRVSAGGHHHITQLGDLTAANVGRRIRSLSALDQAF